MAINHVSEQEKERRRRLALAMHSERHPDDPSRRRFGGPQPNSGPKRQKRMTEIMAERFAREADLMADTVIEAIRSGTHGIQLQAVKLAADIQVREAELQLKEERELDGMSSAALIELIIESAVRANAAGAIGQPAIEGTARDVSGS